MLASGTVLLIGLVTPARRRDEDDIAEVDPLPILAKIASPPPEPRMTIATALAYDATPATASASATSSSTIS